MLKFQTLNLAFAICGILGSKYGMGRKLVYFTVHPENFHKALLVSLLEIPIFPS